jgi:hypothetical protein
VSSTSIKAARATVAAISHGLTRGTQRADIAGDGAGIAAGEVDDAADKTVLLDEG